MLKHRIIPCLDCRDGRVVKGVKFSNLQDMGDPAEHAAIYERQGADELVILDVAATIEARDNQTHVVAAVRRELSIPLTVGGGVRDTESARRLLAAGADKVGVNSAAVRRPELIRELSEEFGSQCIVVAVDVIRQPAGSWRVVVDAGRTVTSWDALEWCQMACDLGAGEILLTSWDRDGTGDGYDVSLLRAVSKVSHVPLIASGGASCPEDLLDAIHAGADAVLAATIFHTGRYTVGDIKQLLGEKGIAVRHFLESAKP
jgi:imidazoleglycerol phosphate synthase cyclase subunit